MRFVLACLFAAAACTSSTSNPPTPDAGSNANRTCTGAAYDPCTTNGQCTSNNCHYYMMSNFTVCTQACDANNPCPNDASGAPGQCNSMGICKPTVANSCTP